MGYMVEIPGPAAMDPGRWRTGIPRTQGINGVVATGRTAGPRPRMRRSPARSVGGSTGGDLAAISPGCSGLCSRAGGNTEGGQAKLAWVVLPLRDFSRGRNQPSPGADCSGPWNTVLAGGGRGRASCAFCPPPEPQRLPIAVTAAPDATRYWTGTCGHSSKWIRSLLLPRRPVQAVVYERANGARARCVKKGRLCDRGWRLPIVGCPRLSIIPSVSLDEATTVVRSYGAAFSKF